MTTDYSSWSTEQLIARVTGLELQLKRQTASLVASARSPSPTASPASSAPVPRYKKPKKAADRVFDPSKYSTRLIALKFAYLGQRYNGFEHHANNTTPLPTIEEEMWKALMKTKLIFPTRNGHLADGELDWEGCEYSKCGRTDRGVSAFGQVIGIRVRSNRPLPKENEVEIESADGAEDAKMEVTHDGAEVSGVMHVGNENVIKEEDEDSSAESATAKVFDPVKDELPYIQLLNRVLPEDIRVLAWCPSPPPDFSARFSCKERRYRYFFTQPTYAPVPGPKGLYPTADGKIIRDGCLDIDAMQDAAKRLEGLHDFRNFCKVDPAKQITNFDRRIFHASVERVDPADGPVGYVGQSQFGLRGEDSPSANGVASRPDHGGPPALYTFNVNGSAFLWHQVRHLVAIMFLVGQGLEAPSIVSDLLDVTKVPTRPKYEMATDAPLVLWDCIFPGGDNQSRETYSQEDTLEWVYVGDDGGRESYRRLDPDAGDGKYGRSSIMDDLWSVWHLRKIDEVLAGSLLDVVARQGRRTTIATEPVRSQGRSVRVHDGGHGARPIGKYVPVLEKKRMDSVEVINARYLVRKGIDGKSRTPERSKDE